MQVRWYAALLDLVRIACHARPPHATRAHYMRILKQWRPGRHHRPLVPDKTYEGVTRLRAVVGERICHGNAM